VAAIAPRLWLRGLVRCPAELFPAPAENEEADHKHDDSTKDYERRSAEIGDSIGDESLRRRCGHIVVS